MAESRCIPPDSKRKRTESNSQSETQEPERSTAYWFEDGNVILQVENIQFRVHRTVIARHSQVFRDMFGLPQPETETLVEGCPLVHVSDAVEDWENIFRILYDNDASYKSTDKFAFSLLSAMLRLGKKYQFETLQAQALERIRLELPSSLEDWDKKFSSGASHPVISSDREVDLVNVLLELGITSLLPVAFFLCILSLHPIDILRGLTRDDGKTSRFSTETIASLMLARDDISEAIVDHEYQWAKAPSAVPTARCSNKYVCESLRSKVFQTLCPGPNPARALRNPRKFIGGYCEICGDEVRRVHLAGRQHIWDNLPSYFELPDWKDLKDV
ncbi:hypothetical protein GALMADRAFT_109535 [Galerina marginata CBS 339.88]|uniref:BTB domain-containing protein n=1 Tax=Galerina marginata (strain CBS 339.88) TaxID=685588 RepID=A0A067U157_GALM3|nr:hypothetical protein GALMADRAFT_109535 [Galerina marginata CBS 339.88]